MVEGAVCCSGLERLVVSEAVPLRYNRRFREWGLLELQVPPTQMLDWRKSATSQGLDYCPSCGARLPGSLRERYFEELERLALEDSMFDPSALPESYQSDEWWRRANL